MKFKFCRNRKKRRRQLVVKLRKGEEPNVRRLRWCVSHPYQNVLPCEGDLRRRRLRYDVEGLTSLAGYLRRTPVSSPVLERMLGSVERAAAWCASGANACFLLLCDPKYVMVGTTGELHFAFLPLEVSPKLAECTPLVVLAALADAGRVRYGSPEAHELAGRLAEFVDSQEGVFSLNALRRFLGDDAVPVANQEVR